MPGILQAQVSGGNSLEFWVFLGVQAGRIRGLGSGSDKGVALVPTAYDRLDRRLVTPKAPRVVSGWHSDASDRCDMGQ